jgi:ABC-type sugar transport system permease subunit/ABC-type glycerol-3-phosphate transport system substrate-binding protein
MKIILFLFTFLILIFNIHADEIIDNNGKIIIKVKLQTMPDATRLDAATQAEVKVLQSFIEKFPKIFKARYLEKYKLNPSKYGKHDWENVSVKFQKFSGISISGQAADSKPLMAIAAGSPPDILNIGFRQATTYVKQNFIYPLDKTEDNYLSSLTSEERSFMFNPKIIPVINRKGVDGKKRTFYMPTGGLVSKIILYRKDLLDAAGIKYPKNNWTWNDLLKMCKKLTDPKRDSYGILLPTGPVQSAYWLNFLWGAGGNALKYDKKKDVWLADYDSPQAAVAMDYYLKLCCEEWTDENGRRRYGYSYQDSNGSRKFDQGRIGLRMAYIDEKLFSSINPDVVGMVPMPIGPSGKHVSEVNCQLKGIFSGIKNPAVRDAAWEYLKFCASKDAMKIRTEMLVDGGMGEFINPRYLRMFGYEDLIQLAPKGWEDIFKIAIKNGRPEPYEGNSQLIYNVIAKPLERLQQMYIKKELPADPQKRLAVIQEKLHLSVIEANELMLGYVAPEEMTKRRIVAVLLLLAIGISFSFVFKRIVKAFTPPKIGGVKQTTWGFKKYFWGYILLIPAVFSVFFWRYIPLAFGSSMAFMDYQIMGGTEWLGVDNFANLLWDPDWWNALYNSLRYSILVISLTFLPPVILAVLLQEVPRGKILFRTLFYLPAVITGLVVIYLWKSFFEPTENGVLNSVIMSIPAIGYILLGLGLFLILFFFAKRLWLHEVRPWSIVCFVCGLLVFWFCFEFAIPMLKAPDTPWYQTLFMTTRDPYRWLLSPDTAMLCCVIPMVWAGMGPGCLIYLAALKGVAPDFYEAADIDGATFIDKILFIVIPILKPLLVIQFVGIFVNSWKSSAFILAMTGGGSNTTVGGLYIFYKAYLFLKFGPAAAMAWVLGFILIGFTVHQLRILSKLEFKTTGEKK